jgi:hypothetical protein
MMQRAQAGRERVGKLIGIARQLIDDTARPLAGEDGDSVDIRGKATAD